MKELSEVPISLRITLNSIFENFHGKIVCKINDEILSKNGFNDTMTTVKLNSIRIYRVILMLVCISSFCYAST